MFVSKCSKYYVGLLPNLTLKRQTTRQMFPHSIFYKQSVHSSLKCPLFPMHKRNVYFVTDHHANAVRLCSEIEKSSVKENT